MDNLAAPEAEQAAVDARDDLAAVATHLDDRAHMAMPSASAITLNPSLTKANEPVFIDGEWHTPGAPEATNAPAADVDVVSTWLEQGNTQSQAELAAIDEADRVAAERELRSLWGDRYEDNVAAINAYLDDDRVLGTGDVARHARRPDGHALANDPAELQALLGLALNPRPHSGGGNLDQEIKEIEAFMRRDRAAYNRDEPLQARYRGLLAIKVGPGNVASH